LTVVKEALAATVVHGEIATDGGHPPLREPDTVESRHPASTGPRPLGTSFVEFEGHLPQQKELARLA
jgi:hypothetical protein